MKILKPLFIALLAAQQLVALAPQERTPAETAVFIEGGPIAESLEALRTLVGSVAGEGVWSIFAANLEQKSGVNLLDAQKLEEIGVSSKDAWAIALNMEIESTGTPSKPAFVIIVPAQNNTKFYDFIKGKITEAQMPVNKEIEPGRMLNFGSENDPGFLVRTPNAVLISNDEAMVKAMQSKASNPIAKAQHYTTMRTHLYSRNQNKAPLVSFYLNPRLIISSLKSQSELLRNLQRDLNKGDENAPVIDDNSPYVAEIRDNLQSSGGAIVANAEKLSFYFSYKYKEGYLSDTTKIYPKIVQVKTAPLASDTLSRNPVHYTLIKVNALAMIELFKSLSPVFTEKYNKGIQDVNTKLALDFEADILRSLRGNYNFQVLNIPPEAKTKDILAWEIYGTFGIKQGTANNWVKLFKNVEKMVKKAEAKKPTKSKFVYEDIDEGKVISITGQDRMSGPKAKPITVVVLVRDTEIIVSNSKANAIKATKGGEKTLSERLTRLTYDSAQGIFFLDLQQVYKAVMKMKQGGSLKPYANMLEKLKNFSILSTVTGDFATAETTLQLRK